MVVMETSLELQCSLTHQIPFLRSIFPVDSAAHPPVLSLLQSDAAPKFGVIPCWFDSSPLFSFFMQPLFAVDSAAQLLCPCVIDFPTTFRHSSPSTSVVHCQRPPCRPCAQPTQNTATCDPRAVADQLEGNEEEHRKYRSMVVKHILDNREMFEPFIEDEVPFDEYCQSMENDGTWAGHMELQAASLVTRSNICIHRNMSPRWYLRNFDNRGVRMIHLSYHDGEHYNSVRLKDDPCDGPARPIIIKADADLSVPSHQTKVVDNKPHGRAGREAFQSGSIKLVMAGTGCENAEKVEQILEQVSGDVDAAIEFLIAEQGTEECSANSDSLPSQANTCGHDENENHKQHKEDMVEESTNDESNNSSKKTNINTTLQPNDKIPRNKVCPCGSKKKYKACCGSALGKQSAKFVVNQAADSKKGKKERKQGKKGISAKAEVPSEYDLVTPDMGALCI